MQIEIIVKLVIEADSEAEAFEAVDAVLDSGQFQDAINTHHEDADEAEAVLVLSAASYHPDQARS